MDEELKKLQESINAKYTEGQRLNASTPRAIITMPGLDSDRVKIVDKVCNTAGACVFIFCLAWVLVTILSR